MSSAAVLCTLGAMLSFGAAQAGDLDPPTPAAFLPGGMLGVQPGGSWAGIAIKSADDPVAEAVMQSFQSQIHSVFQHTGTDVLFVKLPARHLSDAEFLSYSQKAPVLLVQLEPTDNELAVFYGYLAPVNAFGVLTADR
jgi:hypothetical protein